MLGAVQLHRQTGIVAQQIDLQSSQAVERDRQRDIDAEPPLGFWQGLRSRR